MQVKNLEDMMKQQEAVRNGVQGTVDDVESAVIVNSFKGFKDKFIEMQEQIKKGDYSGIDAWCSELGAGVNLKKSKQMNMKKANNPYSQSQGNYGQGYHPGGQGGYGQGGYGQGGYG